MYSGVGTSIALIKSCGVAVKPFCVETSSCTHAFVNFYKFIKNCVIIEKQLFKTGEESESKPDSTDYVI